MQENICKKARVFGLLTLFREQIILLKKAKALHLIFTCKAAKLFDNHQRTNEVLIHGKTSFLRLSLYGKPAESGLMMESPKGR
jgi:hypothetical protein